MDIGRQHKHPVPAEQTCLCKWVRTCSGRSEPGGDGDYGQEGAGGVGEESDGPSCRERIQQTRGMVGYPRAFHISLHVFKGLILQPLVIPLRYMLTW